MNLSRCLAVFVVWALALGCHGSVLAQTLGELPAETGSAPAVAPQAVPGGVELPEGYTGPLPPVAPEVVRRDDEGRAAIRAVRLSQPIRLDGQLDEAIYRDVLPISDFIQMEPEAGAP